MGTGKIVKERWRAHKLQARVLHHGPNGCEFTARVNGYWCAYLMHWKPLNKLLKGPAEWMNYRIMQRRRQVPELSSAFNRQCITACLWSSSITTRKMVLGQWPLEGHPRGCQKLHAKYSTCFCKLLKHHSMLTPTHRVLGKSFYILLHYMCCLQSVTSLLLPPKCGCSSTCRLWTNTWGMALGAGGVALGEVARLGGLVYIILSQAWELCVVTLATASFIHLVLKPELSHNCRFGLHCGKSEHKAFKRRSGNFWEPWVEQDVH